MCEDGNERKSAAENSRTVDVAESVGMVLAHDITEIRPGQFKDRAFSKGHIVQKEDICRLRKLGKNRLYILELAEDEMHEDDAVLELARAIAGKGITIENSPQEGKLNLYAKSDGILSINKEALLKFNMLGEVMCATMHTGSVVSEGQLIGGTRAIPLVIKRKVIEAAVSVAAKANSTGILEVKELRRPRAGIVITGTEVYEGRVEDAFAPVIKEKIKSFKGEVIGLHYCPDNSDLIKSRLKDLISAGADLLITTGGMSVDPDDVTRDAIRALGAREITYGSPVLPGAMFLIAYVDGPDGEIPIMGIPACGMYSKRTVLDLVLPRVLSGEKIGRRELAELGHGGLCLKCEVCRWPVCPFGK
jgi:hypothetical protein